MTKWRVITDREPPFALEVLVVYNGQVTTASREFISKYCEPDHFFLDPENWCSLDEVSCWAPLPEGPTLGETLDTDYPPTILTGWVVLHPDGKRYWNAWVDDDWTVEIWKADRIPGEYLNSSAYADHAAGLDKRYGITGCRLVPYIDPRITEQR